MALEILDPVEFGHSFQGPVEPIVPAMIRTVQDGCAAARLGDDLGGVMPTYIVKSPQLAVCATDSDNGLARDRRGDKLTRPFNLVGAADNLPGVSEHSLRFKTCDTGIHIPRRGNRKGF